MMDVAVNAPVAASGHGRIDALSAEHTKLAWRQSKPKLKLGLTKRG